MPDPDPLPAVRIGPDTTPIDPMECCGYCLGAGRVPGPKHDAYGPRDDYPDLVTCDYCDGSGACEDGESMLPCSRAVSPPGD